jgi:hypothetical protein
MRLKGRPQEILARFAIGARQEAHLKYVPFDFVIAPSGANVSSCVYILMMRDSLYYFIALLCVAVVLGWLIFLMLGA